MAIPTPAQRQPRILLVDDEPNFRWSIARALEMKGYHVSSTGTGEEALELLNRDGFDLVLTDIKMPGIDGFELVEWLRTHRPEIAVVMVTAFGSLSMRERSLSAGSISYIEKPIDLNALTDFLHRFFYAPGFAGRIRDIDLLDYLQLIVNTHKSKVVQVHRRHRVGRMVFENGHLVHAELGELTGLPAFHEILAWEGGDFTDIPYESPERRTVEENTAFLLMEGARVRDERSINPDPTLDKDNSPADAGAEAGNEPGTVARRMPEEGNRSSPGETPSESAAPPSRGVGAAVDAAGASRPEVRPAGPFVRYRRFVEDLLRLPGVQGAVLMSREGLRLARGGSLPPEWESRLAGLTAAAGRAGNALGVGSVSQLALGLPEGLQMLVVPAGPYLTGVLLGAGWTGTEVAAWIQGRAFTLD